MKKLVTDELRIGYIGLEIEKAPLTDCLYKEYEFSLADSLFVRAH